MQITTLNTMAFITSYDSAYTRLVGMSFRSCTKRRIASFSFYRVFVLINLLISWCGSTPLAQSQ